MRSQIKSSHLIHNLGASFLNNVMSRVSFDWISEKKAKHACSHQKAQVA